MTITEIYTNHKDYVFNYVLSVVKNQHDAEDITNDVFVKMINHESVQFDEKNTTDIKTWLRTISYHVIIDFFRRTKKTNSTFNVDGFVNDNGTETFNFFAPTSTNADEKVLNSEMMERVNSAMETLNPNHKKVAELYFLKEMKYKEIAEILEMPLSNVKVTLNRARTKLQAALKTVSV